MPLDEPSAEPHLAGQRRAPVWALTPFQAGLSALGAALFLVLCYLPLRATDLWVHANLGGWILDHGRLPAEDPFQPLARGMALVDREWLSQVVLAGVERALGAEALTLLFALVAVAAYGLLARAFGRAAGASGGAVLLPLAAVFLLSWSRLTTFRPESFALVAFAALVLLTEERGGGRRPAALWVGVPLVMALWANLHGSFPVGVIFLAALAAGAAIDRWRRDRSLGAVVGDAGVRRRIWLAELGAAATLANPYGVDLWVDVVSTPGNANLVDIVEWRAMTFGGPGSVELALSVVVLAALWRHSRRSVRAADVLLLAGFAFAAASSVRMIAWYAPVFGLAVAPHVAELMARRRRAERPAALPRPLWTGIAGIALWVAFALSPASAPLLGAAPRSPEQLYGSSTPLAAARWLAEHPPPGPIFNPQWWGDWLVRAGPPGLEPFVTSNIHLVPQRVWSDYQRISSAEAGWERALDRYRVEVAVVDPAAQPRLARALRSADGWRPLYRDPQAEIYGRAPQAETPGAASRPAEALRGDGAASAGATAATVERPGDRRERGDA